MEKSTKKTILKATTEASVQKAILDFLILKGCIIWRTNTGGRHMSYTSKKTGIAKAWYVAFGPKGQPDLQGWIPASRIIANKAIAQLCIAKMAMPIYIETKRPVGGRKTIEQIAFIENARKDGCFAMFAKSVDEVVAEWERVIRWA